MSPIYLTVIDIATIKIALGICRTDFPEDPRFAESYVRISKEFSRAVSAADLPELRAVAGTK